MCLFLTSTSLLVPRALRRRALGSWWGGTSLFTHAHALGFSTRARARARRPARGGGGGHPSRQSKNGNLNRFSLVRLDSGNRPPTSSVISSRLLWKWQGSALIETAGADSIGTGGMAQRGCGNAAPLPPSILSLLSGGASGPPRMGAGPGLLPPRTETGSSTATAASGRAPDDPLARAAAFLDPVASGAAAIESWSSNRNFDLSSLSSRGGSKFGGGGEGGFGGLTPSLHEQLESMREAGRESTDSSSDKFTGAVLSELANSALNELMQQVGYYHTHTQLSRHGRRRRPPPAAAALCTLCRSAHPSTPRGMQPSTPPAPSPVGCDAHERASMLTPRRPSQSIDRVYVCPPLTGRNGRPASTAAPPPEPPPLVDRHPLPRAPPPSRRAKRRADWRIN